MWMKEITKTEYNKVEKKNRVADDTNAIIQEERAVVDSTNKVTFRMFRQISVTLPKYRYGLCHSERHQKIKGLDVY